MSSCMGLPFIYYGQTAAAEMENAINEMEDEGVHSYILDLRNNPVICSFFSSKVHRLVFLVIKHLQCFNF